MLIEAILGFFLPSTNGIYFDPEQTDLLKHVEELRKQKRQILDIDEEHLKGNAELIVGEWDKYQHAEPDRRLKEIYSASRSGSPKKWFPKKKVETLVNIKNLIRTHFMMRNLPSWSD